MPPQTKPPTAELGSMTLSSGPAVPDWGYFAGDDLEQVPELQWPTSVATYHLMRNDAQIDGLWTGSTQPIRRYRWYIDPNGARDEVVKGLADDLGLPVLGAEEEPKRRRKGRFNWDTHLYHALLAILYGHMFFEQVGAIEDPTARPAWRLKSLAPRMPATLSEVRIASNGDLEWIKQNTGWNAPPIPAARLVPYIWDKEGPNWLGRSMLRPIYRNWLIKDRLLRVDAINHERAGGVPWVEAPEKASPASLKEYAGMATQFKVGEGSGGALPHGAKLHLERPGGPPVVDSIRFHNEEMARAWVMMFMQLGQTETGSRALGQTFVDFFALAQETIAGWVVAGTEGAIENWVDWNYGEDEPAPRLGFSNDDEGSIAVADLASLIDKGVIVVDDDLRATIRERYNLPPPVEVEPDEPTTTPPPEPPAEPPTSPPPGPAQAGSAKRQRRARAGSGGESTSLIPLPPRPLRRKPNDQEIKAAVDFALIDADWMTARDSLVKTVSKQQVAQISELHDAIVSAKGSLTKLAALEAAPVHAGAIETALVEMAGKGASAAVEEATRQGVKLKLPELEKLAPRLAERAGAVDSVLARSLSETAARKALTLTGGKALSAVDVADAVRDHLTGLTDAYLTDQLGGALTQAQNAGRKAAFAEPKPAHIYSSELLDEATCEECVGVDGTEYEDIEAAEADYPTGGFSECLGGPRCRGTLIAIYDEEEATS